MRFLILCEQVSRVLRSEEQIALLTKYASGTADVSEVYVDEKKKSMEGFRGWIRWLFRR